MTPASLKVVVKTAVNGVAAHSRHFHAFISLPKETLWSPGPKEAIVPCSHLWPFGSISS